MRVGFQVSQMSLTRTKTAEVALKNEYQELQQKLEKEMQSAKPGSALDKFHHLPPTYPSS
jgi:hypothetical protein